MKTRHATRIRYALLLARERYESRRLTIDQGKFLDWHGLPKSFLLDGSLEERAYRREQANALSRRVHCQCRCFICP
ncbi:hypothetical protein ACIPY0_12320 [Paenarthrobacter nicotinovorans]|uniref:hypothetical protein n=1 Tax=Paenarthrobacter nicotinovorans TaxID=29320 RepID=UPI00381AFD5B